MTLVIQFWENMKMKIIIGLIKGPGGKRGREGLRFLREQESLHACDKSEQYFTFVLKFSIEGKENGVTYRNSLPCV